MSRFVAVLFLFFVLVVPLRLTAAPVAEKTITLNLPDSVLAEAIKEALPLDIHPVSPSLQGYITVIGIDDLRVTDQSIFCRLRLSGKKLQILTELAGHQINLKVGAIELTFNCVAKLHYDSAKQVLYIKPMLNDISSSKPSNTDIGGTLLPLLNDHDIPVSVKDLAPLIAKTEDRSVAITMHIVDIRAVNGAVQLNIIPRVSSVDISKQDGKRSKIK